MKKNLINFTVLFLCLAMGLSLLPAPALAAELPEDTASQAETSAEEEASSLQKTDCADAEDADASASQSTGEEAPAESSANAEDAVSSASQSGEEEASAGTDPADVGEADSSGETITAGAESAEAEPVETKWIEVNDPTEVTDFIWDNWSDSYFSEAVVDPGREQVTVDGETAAVEDTFGEEAEEAEILESSSVAEDYFDGTAYEAECQSNGTVTVTAPYQTCRIIVNAGSLAEDYGAETILHYADYSEYILQFPDEESTQAAYEKISARYEGHCYLDEVLLAEDILAEAASASYTACSWGADYMGMTELKNSASVSGTVTVAVLDTGCDMDNWFFEGRTFSELSYDFSNQTAGTAAMADSAGSDTGHGTHVAGIITDCTPANVELMILRVFDDEGKCTPSVALNALRYAMENDADIINISLGSDNFKSATKTVWNSVLQTAQKRNIVVTCAAGNSASDVMYPASSAYTIAVSSIKQDGTLASTSCYGEEIDFCAPGDKIYSAKSGGAAGETAKKSGTSMSTPHVAAAFAWLKLLHPEADYDELYQLAQDSAVDLGDTGKDDQFGWGYLYLGSESPVSCTLSKTSYTYNGKECTPSVTVVQSGETLEEGTDYTISYSDNIEPGTASVTVTLTGEDCAEQTLYFTIAKRQPTLSVSVPSTTLYAGETAQLSVSTTSEGALTYDTDDFDIADVDENGLVTAVGAGTVTLYVTAEETDHDEEVYGSVEVTVLRRQAAVSASLSRDPLYVKDTAQIEVSTASDGELFYESDNSDIVSVDEDGVLTATAVGTATVTVTAAESSCYEEASCSVTVTVKLMDTPSLTSAENSTKGIQIKWGAVDGAACYRVFRKTSSGWKWLGDTASASWTDTTAKAGATCTYTVRCVTDDGEFYTSGYSAAGITARRLLQPTLTLSNTAKGITVKWSKVTGADSYDLYRRVGSGSWKKLKSTASTTYTDRSTTNGKQYSYKVIARHKATGSASVYSSAQTACRLTQSAITKLKNSKKKALCLQWKKNSAASGYQVQYAASSSFVGAKTITVKGGSKHCKTLSGLKKGKTYYVRVRSYRTVNGKKVYSAWSSVQSAAVKK